MEVEYSQTAQDQELRAVDWVQNPWVDNVSKMKQSKSLMLRNKNWWLEMRNQSYSMSQLNLQKAHKWVVLAWYAHSSSLTIRCLQNITLYAQPIFYRPVDITLINYRIDIHVLYSGVLWPHPARVTRLHHHWDAIESDIFVCKFLTWQGFEPQTSQSNGRERYHPTTTPLLLTQGSNAVL